MAAPSIERSKLAIIFRTLPVLVALVSASVVTAPAQEVVFSSSFEAWEGPGPGCIASNQICNVNDSAPSLAHSLVEDGLSSGTIDSGGNLFTDPGLGDPDGADNIPGSLDDDLRPAAESPVVDAGSVEHLPPDTFDLDDDGNTAEPVPFDIAGDGRALGPEARPDMGAYESSAEAAQAASQLTRLTAQAAAQQIHYVRPGGAGSGSSWADAYGFLQDALAAAQAGEQIWVAAGVYRPDQGAGLTPGDRALSFQLPAGVRLHGGFAGTESSLAERDLATQRTILSGDLAADDDGLSLHEDNSRHVVRIVPGDDGTLLDGVTVTGGNADGAEDDGLGGGVFVTGGAAWIVNTHVTGSMAECGGGIALTAGATAHLVNTILNGNQAETGGGVCNIGASPSIIHATITSNTAATAPGIYNDSASPTIANSIVSGNRVFDDLDRCEALQYPCSLADVPEDVLAASLAVMQGAWAARDAGTMLDALVYLESHPDVVEAIGDSGLVGARLRGGSFDFLVEAPSWIETSAPTVSVNASTVTMDSSQIREEAPVASPLAAAANRDIVGEDRDGDGKIDNRDGKRALVIDSWNKGDARAAALSLAQTRDYRGRIDVADGKELDDYGSWHNYDFVYLSTSGFVSKFTQGEPRDIRDIIAHIAAPIPLPSVGQEEAQYRAWWYEQGIEVLFETGMIWLSPRFFRKTYNGSLDNAIVYCAACNITGQWVRTLGTSNFGLFGYDFNPLLDEAAPYNSEVVTGLATGLHLEAARPGDSSLDPGAPITGVPTEDAEFMRLIELPLLRYPDSSTVLRDGADLTDSVVGIVGDDDADQLDLHLVLQGVTDFWGFTFRYVVDGLTVPGTFHLGGATPLGSNAWSVTHTLDLGFPLQKGILPIEVIAEVPPNMGKSRFSVNAVVDAFDCSASATISGFRDGAFSGPAVFVLGADSALTLTIKSLEWAIGYDPDGDGAIENAYEATFDLPPELVPYNLELPWEIPLGNELISLVYSYDLGDPWFFGTDHTTGGCAECGGTLTVTDIAPDRSILVGEIDFTGMEGFYDAPDLSHFKAKFRAASDGSEWGGETPYDRCIQQYYQLD